MRIPTCVVVLLAVAACGGCSRGKSTTELTADLKSGDEKSRIIAARTLPRRNGDAAEVVPALIAALKDKAPDIRHDAALGLGSFGEQAKEAIPALQAAAKSDRDIRVRKAASVALSRIDPSAVSKAGAK